MTEMARALETLTGENLGPYPELWARWWEGNRVRVLAGEIPLGKGKPGTGEGKGGRYYGIPQDATRMIYVLDVSGSMTVSMENPEWVDGTPLPPAEGEESRFDAARKELLRAIRNLRRGTLFAVVVTTRWRRSPTAPWQRRSTRCCCSPRTTTCSACPATAWRCCGLVPAAAWTGTDQPTSRSAVPIACRLTWWRT